MPEFAGYKDMDACIAANGDKADPKAFCSALMDGASEAEKADRQKKFTIAQKNDDQNLVFGWASVAVKNDGNQLVDLQDDVIDPADLEKAAYDFMLMSRTADEMHDGRPIGQMIESSFWSPEKRKAMGVPEGGSAPQYGWWVGFKLSPAAYAKVKDGTYKMFSIEGGAVPVEV